MIWALLACAPAPDEPPAREVPPLLLSIEGLGPEIARAISSEDRLSRLASALPSCLERPSLAIDYRDQAGNMTLVAQAGRCDSPALRAAARALARYRDEVALSVQRRLSTFDLALQIGGCRLALAGQIPPDGSTFSPCVGTREAPCPRGLEGVEEIPRAALEGCLDQGLGAGGSPAGGASGASPAGGTSSEGATGG